MSFTKKPIRVRLDGAATTLGYRDKKICAEVKDGAVRSKVVACEVPIDEVVEEMKVFVPSDYTLENLLKAGVPLDRVNVANLIHSDDKSAIEEQLSSVADDAWYNLQVIDWKSSTPTVETNEVKSDEK